MQDTEFFAVTARARVGFKHVACIAAEQDKLPVAYATAEGALGHQVASRFPVVVLMGKGYAGIVPEQVLVMI